MASPTISPLNTFLEGAVLQQFARDAQRMTIADCQAFPETFTDDVTSRARAEAVLRVRLDPIQYLSEFFSKPVEVLTMMRLLMVILSGSRAAEYFVPGSCVAGSDLDFYCRMELAPMVQFWLEALGVDWTEESGPPEHGGAGPNFADYTVSGFKVRRGIVVGLTGITYEIQLISGNSCMASSCIFDFHSTTTQCFLTGFAAVSLYDAYSSAALDRK